jgi:ribonucleoside-triphosphate reductase
MLSSRRLVMQNNLLGDVAFAAQYARPLPSNEGRENWAQAVNRVEAMHLKKFPQVIGETQRAFKLVRDKRVFPSQRSTQFGGSPIERNNMRIYNCTYSPCDRSRFFSEAFWLLLSGCGTGFSVRGDDIARLPRLLTPTEAERRLVHEVLISDNIEGWARAAQTLIDSYLHRGYYEDYRHIRFDYSAIRPKGADISSGGKAPGSKPLEVALEKIRALLDRCIADGQARLRSVDAFDIVMFLSEAVLSGGVRRSASIAIFDETDELMMKAKVGDWWKDNPQRAYANISAGVGLDVGRQVVDEVVEMAKAWGEPGVAFFASPMHGTNPCAEIGLFPYTITTPTGQPVKEITLDMLSKREALEAKGYLFQSGWAVCNLTEINGALIKSKDDFLEACRAASHIGTLQAGYTNQGYLTRTTKMILEQEALIGVSITGMCAAPDLLFDPEVLEEGARLCVEVNREIAAKIGINTASRVTTVKPSGNTSTIAGTSAGVHPFHAQRYIRRMRVAKVNPVWGVLEAHVPDALTHLDEHTGVVAFACAAPEGSLTRETDSALEHLERVKLVYQHWVAPGSAPTRVEGLTHNVSNTCTVKDDEWGDVATFIYTNRDKLRGVALLGWFGDSAYDQAPYQTVEEGAPAEELWLKLASIDWSGVDLNNIQSDYYDAQLEPACAGGQCSISL